MVNKPKRRTHWQAVAARKYRRMLFLGGDGGPTECWVVLTKCPRYELRLAGWGYSLRPDRLSAEQLFYKWNTSKCGQLCEGQHRVWRLIE